MICGDKLCHFSFACSKGNTFISWRDQSPLNMKENAKKCLDKIATQNMAVIWQRIIKYLEDLQSGEKIINIKIWNDDFGTNLKNDKNAILAILGYFQTFSGML